MSPPEPEFLSECLSDVKRTGNGQRKYMLPLGDYSRQRRSRGRGGEDNTAGGRNGVFGPTSALSQYFRVSLVSSTC